MVFYGAPNFRWYFTEIAIFGWYTTNFPNIIMSWVLGSIFPMNFDVFWLRHVFSGFWHRPHSNDVPWPILPSWEGLLVSGWFLTPRLITRLFSYATVSYFFKSQCWLYTNNSTTKIRGDPEELSGYPNSMVLAFWGNWIYPVVIQRRHRSIGQSNGYTIWI